MRDVVVVAPAEEYVPAVLRRIREGVGAALGDDSNAHAVHSNDAVLTVKSNHVAHYLTIRFEAASAHINRIDTLAIFIDVPAENNARCFINNKVHADITLFNIDHSVGRAINRAIG